MANSFSSRIVLFTLAMSISATFAVPISIDSLSRAERSAIKKLRLLVKDALPHEYMKDDLYLVRWLTMKKFNVDQTISFVKENIKWREDQKMDNVLKEDWTDLHQIFPYSLDTKDKQGRPILYFRYGAWDIGELANSGKMKVLSRYFAKLLEEADSKVREIRAEGNENVSQFDLIINLKGYSLGKHACYQCLSFYSEIGNILEKHYPGTANKIVFLNSPAIFTSTFGILQTVMNDNTKESIKLMGEDRHLWEPVLLEFIDRDQFPAELY